MISQFIHKSNSENLCFSSYQLYCMSTVSDQSLFFPLGSPSEIYQKIATPEERQNAEHPYEYLQRVYKDVTPNSRLTGLPGYSPPWPVRIINGVTVYTSYLVLLLFLQFFVTLTIALTATAIEMISNIQFTVEIPYTGWVLYNLSPATTAESEALIIVMTPLLLSFLLFWGGIVLFMVVNKISKTLSRPYEKEYAEWLDELEPVNTALPPGLAYEMRDEDEQITEGGVPIAAPSAFREVRTFEKIMYSIKTVRAIVWAFFASATLMHSRVMIQQAGWIDDMDELASASNSEKRRRH